MFGPPKDKEGDCNARLFLGDDYGDNHTTIKCMLPEGHEGKHKEWFTRSYNKNDVVIEWTKDERKLCENCKTPFDDSWTSQCPNCSFEECCGCDSWVDPSKHDIDKCLDEMIAKEEAAEEEACRKAENSVPEGNS